MTNGQTGNEEKYSDDVYKQMYEYLTKRATYDFEIYRWTLWFLGGTALLVIALSFYLLAQPNGKASEGLIAIASAAVGAMAGLLAPSTLQKTEEPK